MRGVRQAVLRRRLQASGQPGAEPARVVPRRADQSQAALSPEQLHTWRYEQAHPGSLSNVLGLEFTFEGAVQKAALITGLRALVARHEILRTTYEGSASDMPPRQVIHTELPFSCHQIAAGAEESRRQAQKLMAQPFDLSRDAPLRVLICRTGPQQVILTLVVHHILWDGATFDLICRELEQLCSRGVLPDLLCQYGDLTELPQTDPARVVRTEAFWQSRFSSQRPALSLAAFTGDASAPQEAAGRVDRVLASSAALMQLATAHRVTPFKAFMACWARVLWSQAPQSEVCVGTTVLNRTMPGSQYLIGNFANHIPLCLRLQQTGSALSSAELLPTVGEEIDLAFSHADLPYEQLCALLGCDDPTAPPRLFDSLVVFIPSGTEAPRLPGSRCRWRRLHSGATQFPLVPLGLEVFAHGRGPETRFALEATYARQRFDADSITRLLDHLEATISDANQLLW